MSSGYTKGPWYWSDAYPMSGSGERTWSLVGADGYGILSCDGVENSPQGLNDHDNARLIEMAPELLEGLQYLYRAYVCLLESGMDRITSLGGDCDPVDYMEKRDSALIKTRQLIAKATGATP